MAGFWKILRVLTTNQCNYRCLYCHNEGQEKKDSDFLSLENFINICQSIDGLGFQEIRFSGGEPLVNPKTIDMIEWLNDNSEYEIGLATNASLLTEEIVERLAKTRILLTIHFPAVDEAEYERVTGKSNAQFWGNIDLLEKYGVEYSFNFVLYPEIIRNFENVLSEVIQRKKKIKILPYIERGFNNYSDTIISELEERLDMMTKNTIYSSEDGVKVWKFDNGGKAKLIYSPCYSSNINVCRSYGELRLLPDLSLQKCIFDNKRVSIEHFSELEIRNTISKLWEEFNNCSSLE